jgi:regulator of sirC expression with transglutaminase-like and TPR domain
MTPPPLTPRDALAALGALPDESIDLAEAALFLSALDHPGQAIDPYRDHLAAMSLSLRGRRQACMNDTASAAPTAGAFKDDLSAQERGVLLSEVIAGEWDYQGDSTTYDDPQNADMMRVIDRRRGLPVSLGILYLQVARSQGWSAHGLNFPGHFLIRLDGEGGDRVILDPFHAGQQLQVPELRAMLKLVAGQGTELTPETYLSLSNRQVLMRLQSNVKLRMLEAGRIDAALEAVRRMMLLSPDDHRLWREAGLMLMRLGDLETALESLDQYLALAPAGEDRARIEQVMSELHERLH